MSPAYRTRPRQGNADVRHRANGRRARPLSPTAPLRFLFAFDANGTMHAPDAAAVQRQIHTRGGQRARVLTNSVPTTLVAEGVIDGKGGIVFDRPLTCRVGVPYRLVVAPKESSAREARHLSLRDDLEDAHKLMSQSTGTDLEDARKYFLEELFRVCRADSRLFHCPDDPSREHPIAREWVDTLRATGQREFLMKFPRRARNGTARRLTKLELQLIDEVDTLRWGDGAFKSKLQQLCEAQAEMLPRPFIEIDGLKFPLDHKPTPYDTSKKCGRVSLRDVAASMRAAPSGIVFHRKVHVSASGICSAPIDQSHAGWLVRLAGIPKEAPLYGRVGASGILVFDKAKPRPGVKYSLVLHKPALAQEGKPGDDLPQPIKSLREVYDLLVSSAHIPALLRSKRHARVVSFEYFFRLVADGERGPGEQGGGQLGKLRE